MGAEAEWPVGLAFSLLSVAIAGSEGIGLGPESTVFIIVIATLLAAGAVAQLRVSNRIGDRGEVLAMVALPTACIAAILLMIPWGHPLFTAAAVLVGLAFMAMLSVPALAYWGLIKRGDWTAGFRILFRGDESDVATPEESARMGRLDEGSVSLNQAVASETARPRRFTSAAMVVGGTAAALAAVGSLVLALAQLPIVAEPPFIFAMFAAAPLGLIGMLVAAAAMFRREGLLCLLAFGLSFAAVLPASFILLLLG
ncbi:MAG: hypothetical protein Q7V53_04990 [Caldisericota bacterium]|nr:hypothetical protein [Caldisericota bacterium]